MDGRSSSLGTVSKRARFFFWNARARQTRARGSDVESPSSRPGDLVNLETLLLATNRLQTLPITFGNLTRLERVIADCNRLRRIPETMSRMTCHTLSFNCNALVSLPRCLVNMASLTLLSANDNKLQQLPMNMGASKSLVTIKLCANEIGEIPESLSKTGAGTR